MTILRLGLGPVTPLDALRAAARAEGYAHLERLAAEWAAGRFTGVRVLLGWDEGPGLVAVGGLTPDPYDPAPDLLRVRRVYVHPDHRRRGLGGRLAAALVAAAPAHVRRLSLRAPDERAARFWEAAGFRAQVAPGRTHLRARD